MNIGGFGASRICMKAISASFSSGQPGRVSFSTCSHRDPTLIPAYLRQTHCSRHYWQRHRQHVHIRAAPPYRSRYFAARESYFCFLAQLRDPLPPFPHLPYSTRTPPLALTAATPPTFNHLRLRSILTAHSNCYAHSLSVCAMFAPAYLTGQVLHHSLRNLPGNNVAPLLR